MKRQYGDDSGFTLIELLVATTIMVVLVATMAEALILGENVVLAKKGAAAGGADTNASLPADQLTRYLLPDLASAAVVTPTNSATCAQNNGLTLTWSQDGVNYTATYTVVADGTVFAATRQLTASPGSSQTSTYANDLTTACDVTVTTAASGAVNVAVLGSDDRRRTVTGFPRSL